MNPGRCALAPKLKARDTPPILRMLNGRDFRRGIRQAYSSPLPSIPYPGWSARVALLHADCLVPLTVRVTARQDFARVAARRHRSAAGAGGDVDGVAEFRSSRTPIPLFPRSGWPHLCFDEPPPKDAEVLHRRLVCLGDDARGRAIEVIAVEGDKDDLIVIHAMALRDKYLDQYQEAKQWRL